MADEETSPAITTPAITTPAITTPETTTPTTATTTTASTTPPIPLKRWNSAQTALILIVLIVLIGVAGWFLPPGWNFIILMVLMILFMMTLGKKISGRPAGILINERNLISLSRFQMVLWTVLILSAYLVAALGRLKAGGVSEALNITLDEKLWGLLGISTASLVGTPLIQSTKNTQAPKDTEVAKTATKLNEGQDEIRKNSQGVLYANPSIQDAAFSDMFEGDEVGNTAYVDLAKVQMFFFTMIAGLSYGAELYKWILANGFAADIHRTDFPYLSGSLIALLGISHAGYLTNGTTTHTPTKDPS